MISCFKQFDHELTELNKKPREYENSLTVAKGYAVYERDVDRTYMDVFRRADDAMYMDKKSFYEER